ncbi:MAG: D-alanine--D-alanine ligase family protein [Chitinivibrionales bacterium]
MNVNVIMGGPSAEHEVSLSTGREVLLHIDRNKYTPRAVVITRDKAFYCSTGTAIPSPEALADPASSEDFFGPIAITDSDIIWKDCDVAFLALHGEFGEDGLIQGFLETINIPYTGSGVYASAVGMNKITVKQLCEQFGVGTAPYTVFTSSDPHTRIEKLENKHGYPCFVKCPQSGSSRLMGRADTREQLQGFLEEFSRLTNMILVESAVNGDEFSCPILSMPNGTFKPLPPVLIQPVKDTFFDYEAKYTSGACKEIVPAPCSKDLTRRIQQTALAVHTFLGCRGMSRTDIIVSDDRLYVLEINTLPGLTSNSLAPKAFSAQGGTYSELLDILIQSAHADKGKK